MPVASPGADLWFHFSFFVTLLDLWCWKLLPIVTADVFFPLYLFPNNVLFLPVGTWNTSLAVQRMIFPARHWLLKTINVIAFVNQLQEADKKYLSEQCEWLLFLGWFETIYLAGSFQSHSLCLIIHSLQTCVGFRWLTRRDTDVFSFNTRQCDSLDVRDDNKTFLTSVVTPLSVPASVAYSRVSVWSPSCTVPDMYKVLNGLDLFFHIPRYFA